MLLITLHVQGAVACCRTEELLKREREAADEMTWFLRRMIEKMHVNNKMRRDQLRTRADTIGTTKDFLAEGDKSQ